jgi:hypothetical protein
MGASSMFEGGVTKAMVAPGGTRWDVTGWIRVGAGSLIKLQRGMGVAGIRTGQVWANSSGNIDWSTLETKGGLR